jgi:preprotein translocase subunit SecY
MVNNRCLSCTSTFYLGTITQAFLPYEQFRSAYYIDPQSIAFYVPSVVILVAGSIFAMWLGEKITDKGIGNGISILIMVGIYLDFHLLSSKSLPLKLVTED